jgi:anaerobic sulfite reductase subunit B
MATASRTEPAAAAGPMTPRPFRVARRRRETSDTWTLELEPVSGPPLAVSPGQFTMLYVFGVGEVPISVSVGGDGPLVHTVRAVGAVSQAICDSRPGAVLGVRGPFGNAWPVGSARGRDVLIMAGGIGMAPLRPAVLEVLAKRDDYQRVALLYGARMPADLLYRRQLERWRGRLDMDVKVTVDAAEPGWVGNVGVVPELLGHTPYEPANTTAFVCGPQIMIHFTALALKHAGVPTDRIFISMERNMRCGVGHCGHCQLGPTLICRDGPVYPYDEMRRLMAVREL